MSVSLQLLIQFFSSAVLKQYCYLNDFQRVSRRCLEGAPGHVNGISINTSSFSIMLFNYCLMPVLHCIGLNILNSAFFSFIGAHQFFFFLILSLKNWSILNPSYQLWTSHSKATNYKGTFCAWLSSETLILLKEHFLSLHHVILIALRNFSVKGIFCSWLSWETLIFFLTF